jgi:hypothetical protein
MTDPVESNAADLADQRAVFDLMDRVGVGYLPMMQAVAALVALELVMLKDGRWLPTARGYATLNHGTCASTFVVQPS